MCFDAINEVRIGIENVMQGCVRPIGEFLDNHPLVYKVCIVVDHFFRAFCMAALMVASPFGMPCGLMLGLSFLYMVTVELRFCSWRFTLPSTLGAFALWASKASLVNIVSRIAFTSIFMASKTVLGLSFLAAYTGLICVLSHQDIEAYLERKNARPKSCCDNS